MHYKFSVQQPNERYLKIECTAQIPTSEFVLVKLPVWRPGRYELGNFARNIIGWEVSDGHNPLMYKKINSSCWNVKTAGVKEITISYKYFSNQLDAGGCYVDEHQIYINPIHCCVYLDELMNEKCTVELEKNKFKHTATSLKPLSVILFEAENFHELVDSPIISSDLLKHYAYKLNNTNFHIWIQGHYFPGAEKLIHDFKSFSEIQLHMMKSFPFDEYHFMIQATPHTFYHGVEHLKSTVLAIGPAASLNTSALYNELIGVASHELFHAWNIKTIRPVEMLPYDYAKENFAETGFVYEGATTYYGDLFLFRNGFFSVDEYFNELNIRINKHLNNPGRFNYSVAQSSFDTWLDGYVPGVPGRKTSIYDEGCLIALMLDFLIRRHSNLMYSLDDVFRTLYFDYGKKNKGYSSADVQLIAEQFAGRSLQLFFSDVVFSATSYESLLHEILDFAGLQLIEKPAALFFEKYFGFKTENTVNGLRITSMLPNSPATKAGLSVTDEIVALNGLKVIPSVLNSLNAETLKEITLAVFTNSTLKTVVLKPDDNYYFSTWHVQHQPKNTEEQVLFFNQWKSGLP